MIDSPILYQTPDCTVTLLDIPASIALGQGIQGRILSNQARSEPFLSTEPKTQKARNKVLVTSEQAPYQVKYIDLLTKALEDIRCQYDGPWALPRFTGDENVLNTNDLRRAEDQLSTLFSSLTRLRSKAPTVRLKSRRPAALEILENWDGSYCNDTQDEVHIQIPRANDIDALMKLVHAGSEDEEGSNRNFFAFRIPQQSSCLLSDCGNIAQFRNHIRWMAQEYDKSRSFDFILLDPPWENRSAKRRAAYDTSSVQALIDDMDLSSYLQPGGLVGVWVTNKSAHRELVLGASGIFESLNLSLVEEWIWVKTTATGEPLTPLDGIWRKPYEVLLLGRAPESRLQIAHREEEVIRRVIVGAPDLHSRKPCLKTLIEPFLPPEYQALEIFARYLVQGWASWGNEVFKYNFDGYYECQKGEEKHKA